MKKNISYILTVAAFVLCIATAQAQQKRTVQFIGGARSFMANNQISVQDTIPDTTTVKRNTGGYALLDLGVNIKPNKNTEILGMFRITNNYGGFWGSGVTFGVRQLSLKGVVGDVVRYQVGDMNIKQTPFTLYNHNADRIDSLPVIFDLQQDIVKYERFYQKNTWRQQGVNVDFGFKFAKYIQELNFTGYTTRLQATDFGAIPDRLMSGATVGLMQSKHLKLGFNGFYVHDLRGTTPDTSHYNNTVQSVNVAYIKDLKNLRLEAKAETGNSQVFTTKNYQASYLSDYFIHAYVNIALIEQNISFTGGYLDVGPDFRSIGAQSKNVNYAATPNFYNRYTNKQINRPLGVLDIIRNDNLYSAGVSTQLMPQNAVYNNVMPFGIATFNRAGFFGKINYRSPKGITVNAEHFSLSEIRGQGTLKLKQFTQNKVVSVLDLNKLLGFEKMFKVQLGVNYQTTNRNSDFEGEKVALNSMQYHAGFEVEVLSKIDVLGGLVAMNTKGNDFFADRNEYSTVSFLTNQQYNLAQQLMAFGTRCRFNERIYLCAMYQMQSYNDRTETLPSYNVNQFSIIYNMTF